VARWPFLSLCNTRSHRSDTRGHPLMPVWDMNVTDMNLRRRLPGDPLRQGRTRIAWCRTPTSSWRCFFFVVGPPVWVHSFPPFDVWRPCCHEKHVRWPRPPWKCGQFTPKMAGLRRPGGTGTASTATTTRKRGTADLPALAAKPKISLFIE